MHRCMRLVPSRWFFRRAWLNWPKDDCTHTVRVRGVHESRRDTERPYLKRFFDWFGPPDTPADLFGRLNAESVTQCLIDYALKYGPGSRRSMQDTVRLFLRFAYHTGYVERDLSALSLCARQPRMGHVMRPIPQDCIETLQNSITGDTPGDLRDRAIMCLLSTYGVRGVQVRRLCLEDVDWSRERICFCAVKRGRAVEQHLTASVGNRLAEYLRDGRPNSSHSEVFLHTDEPFGPLACPRELSPHPAKTHSTGRHRASRGCSLRVAWVSSRLCLSDVWTCPIQGCDGHAGPSNFPAALHHDHNKAVTINGRIRCTNQVAHATSQA